MSGDGVAEISENPDKPRSQFNVQIDFNFLDDNSNGNLTYSSVIVVHHDGAGKS